MNLHCEHSHNLDTDPVGWRDAVQHRRNNFILVSNQFLWTLTTDHTSPSVSEGHQCQSHILKFPWTATPLVKEYAGQGLAMKEQFRYRQPLLRVHGHLGCTYHSVKRQQFPSLPPPPLPPHTDHALKVFTVRKCLGSKKRAHHHFRI